MRKNNLKQDKLRKLILHTLQLRKQVTNASFLSEAKKHISGKRMGYSSGEVTGMLIRLKREGLIEPTGKAKKWRGGSVTLWSLKNSEANT